MLTFFSLAIADFIIGAYSIPFFTMTLVTENQKWPLRCFSHDFKKLTWGFFTSRELCDIWLSIDYMASNASVMNLLAISVDRWRILKEGISCFTSFVTCLHDYLACLTVSLFFFQDHLLGLCWWGLGGSGWGSLTFTFILLVFAKNVKSRKRDKMTK